MSIQDIRERREAIIQEEIERSVAKWKGVLPGHMLRVLRELAEEYYRTDPVAVWVINTLIRESARDARDLAGDAPGAGQRPKRGARRWRRYH